MGRREARAVKFALGSHPMGQKTGVPRSYFAVTKKKSRRPGSEP
jgi:hypothetical protein